MQNAAIAVSTARPRRSCLQSPAQAATASSLNLLPGRCQCDPEHPSEGSADQQFVVMLDAYRESGGLCRAQELRDLMGRSTAVGGRDAGALNRWIRRREVICFEWQANAWLPWFQFKGLGISPSPQPHAHLQPVLAELNAVYDPWELACWFARPNPWLSGCMPVDALLASLPEVVQAARADRFIAH